VLRLVGIGFMLPHLSHIDERIYACQVDEFRGLEHLSGETENYAFYPELVPGSLGDDAVRGARPPARDLQEHREAGGAKFVSLTLTSPGSPSCLVPATYLLARRFVTRRGR
jgi:hypothetical protein